MEQNPVKSLFLGAPSANDLHNALLRLNNILERLNCSLDITPLKITSKSVTLITEGYFIKAYSDYSDYAQELLAYNIFEDSNLIPELVLYDDINHTIVTKELNKSKKIITLEEYVVTLSHFHGYINNHLKNFEILNDFTLSRVLENRYFEGKYINTSNDTQIKVYTFLIERLGGNYISYSHSDIKREHFIKSGDRVNLIDFDSFSFCTFDFIDIYLLLFDLGFSRDDTKIKAALECYVTSRNQHSDYGLHADELLQVINKMTRG